MTEQIERSGSSGPCWWETPGSLRSCLLRLDGLVGVVVNAEKRVVDPAVVSGEVAGQLRRVAQQWAMDAGDGMVEQSDREFGFEHVQPGFTRQGGSFRRQGSPHGVSEPGE